MWPDGLRIVLTLLGIGLLVEGSDVFCGNLTIYKQKWFSKEAQTLAAQRAPDLKSCLDACCAIQVCNAVTFMGFLGNSSSVPSSNCVLFQCSNECIAVDEHEAAEGVISVLVKRKDEAISQKDEPNDLTTAQDTTTMDTTVPSTETTEESTTASIMTITATTTSPTTTTSATTTTTTTESTTISPLADHPTYSASTTAIPTSTTTSLTQAFMNKAAMTPVWSVGLGLVLLVVCVGLNITAITLYLCYRRKNGRTRGAPVNTIKTSTLHAFPPQQHQGPVMHSTMA